MEINTPKNWLLHFYYSKTMVNFRKGETTVFFLQAM